MQLILAVTCLVGVSAGPVQFSGTAGICGEYGWVTGDSLVSPRPELRFTLSPQISFWGFPLSLDILASTMESNLRQQLDKFKLFLHPKDWIKGMTEAPNLAFSIKGIELGSCNPSWTPLTLSGAPVLGGAFELNPWYVYMAGAGGRSQRAVVVSESTQGAYSRMLYSGRFGFGKREGTHFYLTGLYAKDNPNSLTRNNLPMPGDTTPPIDSFEAVKPQENYVLGAQFNLDLAKAKFHLESEFTGCEVTRDNRLPVEHWDWMPDWIGTTFNPRLSSSVDYAFRIAPVFTVADVRFDGRIEYVGPGYTSLGAPNLRKDNFVIGAGASRSFFNGAVSLSASYSNERDNLLSEAVRDSTGNVARVLTGKDRTTRFERWGANAGLAFPNLPYLQLSYNPYTQTTLILDSMARAADSTTLEGNVASASAGYSFQTGTVSHNPSANVDYSDVRGVGTGGDYAGWNAGLCYSVGFSPAFSLSASGGYSRTMPDSGPVDTRITVEATPSYTLFEKWTHTLRLGSTFGTAMRIDMQYSSSFPVWKICDGRVVISDGIYRGSDGRYNDLRLTAELSKSW